MLNYTLISIRSCVLMISTPLISAMFNEHLISTELYYTPPPPNKKYINFAIQNFNIKLLK